MMLLSQNLWLSMPLVLRLEKIDYLPGQEVDAGMVSAVTKAKC
jgi:hypothetical protein